MEVSVYNVKGEDTGRKVVLDDAVFGIEPNDHAIYLAVKLYRANQRQGTHKSKERSEMSGSTRKLGRQKDGGGARRAALSDAAQEDDIRAARLFSWEELVCSGLVLAAIALS